MKKTLLFLLYCLGTLSVQAQVTVTNYVPITPTTIGRYEKFELGLALSTALFSNDFDPDEIDVYAVFTNTASNTSRRINGFWYKGFVQHDDTPDPTIITSFCGKGKFAASGVSDPGFLTPEITSLPWRIRFAPDLTGDWTYQVFVKSGGVITGSQTFHLTCTPSDKDGYIGVGSNKTHFVYHDNKDNEQLFVPLGVNTFTIEASSLVFNRAEYRFIKRVMDRMASAKGNTVRIFMTAEQFGIEWNEDGVGKYYSRQNRAFMLDRVIDLAEKLGVKIQLVLTSNHEFTNLIGTYWTDNPYRALLPNVTATEQMKFFTNAACIKYFKNKMRYIIARWGYSPGILSYEIWNEVMLIHDANPGIWEDNNSLKVNDWFETIVNYGRSLDNKHMYTNSGDGPMFFNFGNAPLDYVQDHFYSNDKNVLYNLSVFANYSRMTYDKPYLMGEYGPSGPCVPDARAYTQDYFLQNFGPGTYAHNVVDFHNSLWAGLFNGSAGPPYYFFANTLFDSCTGGAYKQFQPVAEFLEGDNFFALKHRFFTNTPTSPKGPKDNHGNFEYDNNSIPAWCYYKQADVPSNPLSLYTAYEIQTSNDKLLEVFAASSRDQDGRIYGWAHYNENYWYRITHITPLPPDCNLNCDDNMPTSPSDLPVLRKQTVTFKKVDCDGAYKIEFYSTYPQYDINGDNVLDDGGIIPVATQWANAYCGELTINLPDLAPIGSMSDAPTAPDYAFKITKVQDYWSHTFVTGGLSQGGRVASYIPGTMYYSDGNGAISKIILDQPSKTLQTSMVSPASLNINERVLGPICVNENDQVYYRGYDGRLQCYYWGNSIWNHIWLTDWANTSQNVANYIASGPSNIFYQGMDARMHRYYYDAAANLWQHSILPDNNDPNQHVGGAVEVNQANNHVFYKGADGRLQCYYFLNGIWNHIWLTNWANNSQNVAGDIKLADLEVYYAGTDGYLHKYYFSNNTWTHVIVVDGANQPVPISATTRITLVNNADQIFYLGTDNQVQHLYAKQGNKYYHDRVICDDDVRSDYAGNGIIASDNQTGIYYVGLDNQLHLYAYDFACNPRNSKPVMKSEAEGSNFSEQQTGISGISGGKAEKINLYPNPFTDQLKIQTSTEGFDEVKITDMVGRVYYKGKPSDNKKITVNTENYPSGMYIVQLLFNSKVIYQSKAVKL